MAAQTKLKFAGTQGEIVLHCWEGENPAAIVVLVHGHGEHGGRYDHVAGALVESADAVVYAPDLLGHGESDGERVLVDDFDDYVSDVRSMVKVARDAHPGKPLGLIGHGLGGIIATRYAQEFPTELDALVLSAPLIGGNPDFQGLLDQDPFPEVSIDPELLSREPQVAEAYVADQLVWHGPIKRATLATTVEAIGKVAAGSGLGTIPALWIHGDEDQLAPLELTRAAIGLIGGEQMDETVYPGARHDLFNETNRGDVIIDVVRFLERAFGGAPGQSDSPSPQEKLTKTNLQPPQDRLAT